MNRKRDPRGIPTGGRFAADSRSESDVQLPHTPVSVAELALTKGIAELSAQVQERDGGRLVDARLYALGYAVRSLHPEVLRVTLIDQGDGRWTVAKGATDDHTKPVIFERPLTIELPGPVSLSRDYTAPFSAHGQSPTLTVDVHSIPKNGPDQTEAERKYAEAVDANVQAVAGAVEAEIADDFPDAVEMVVYRRHLDSGRYTTELDTFLDSDGNDIVSDPDLDGGAWDRAVGNELFQDAAFCDLDLLAAEKSGAVERRGENFIINLRNVTSPRNAPPQAETLF